MKSGFKIQCKDLVFQLDKNHSRKCKKKCMKLINTVINNKILKKICTVKMS